MMGGLAVTKRATGRINLRVVLVGSIHNRDIIAPLELMNSASRTVENLQIQHYCLHFGSFNKLCGPLRLVRPEAAAASRRPPKSVLSHLLSAGCVF